MHYKCCVAFLSILCISLPVNLQATKLGIALKWNGVLITFRFRFGLNGNGNFFLSAIVSLLLSSQKQSEVVTLWNSNGAITSYVLLLE